MNVLTATGKRLFLTGGEAVARAALGAGVAGTHYPMREGIEVALDEAGVTGVFVAEVLPSQLDDVKGAEQIYCRINIIMPAVFFVVIHSFYRVRLWSTLSAVVCLNLPSKICTQSRPDGHLLNR